MHPTHLAIIALDLAHERVREAEARYRYHDALERPGTPGLVRRTAARGAVAVSRASAALARRLDGQLGDRDRLTGRSTPA